MTHQLPNAIVNTIGANELTRSEILAGLVDREVPCTLPQFYAAMKVLIAEGSVERLGSSRGTRYRVVDR
jgi:Fe2+ or Zn2+ uptake regulation protein